MASTGAGSGQQQRGSTPTPTGRRERLRQQQDAEEARARRRRGIVMGAVASLVILALVVGFALYGRHRRHVDDERARQAASGQGLVTALASIPASTYDAVGAGSAVAPTRVPNGAPEMVDGKPRLLYMGAEFCPYCGMSRLSMVAALERFGRFSGLTQTTSSPTDTPSSIPTVTFHGSSYTSRYLVFAPFEVEDRAGRPLETLPAHDQQTVQKYDSDAQGNESFPFLYWGTGHYGTVFDGSRMQDMSPERLAAALGDAGSDETRGVVGGANVISAQLCTLTRGQPAAVCDSAGVKAAAAR